MGVMLAIITIIRALKNKMQENDFLQNENALEDDKQQKKHRAGWKITTIILSIVGIIVFLLTEDMTKPVGLVDNWTIINAIIFVLEVVGYMFAFKREKHDGYDDDNMDVGSGATV